MRADSGLLMDHYCNQFYFRGEMENLHTKPRLHLTVGVVVHSRNNPKGVSHEQNSYKTVLLRATVYVRIECNNYTHMDTQ